MLDSYKIIAFVATRDPQAAKSFYRDTLGLRLKSEDPFALVFDVNETMLRVATVPELVAAKYTVLGWQVPDISATVAELERVGVRFERFPGMMQNEHGIWDAPSGAKVAWFRDPDGNILSLTQF